MTFSRPPHPRRAAAAAALTITLLGVTAAPASADVSASIVRGSLRVLSDGDSDEFTIRLNPFDAGSVLVQTPDALIANHAREDFANIVVDAGEGNDRILVAGSEVFTVTDPITVNAGGGLDRFEGGDGRETVLAGPDPDRIEGRGGDDVLIGEAGDDVIVGGAGSDTLTGANDADIFEWETGEGADVVRGGDGSDTLRVTGGSAPDRFLVAEDGGSVRLTHDLTQGATSLEALERIDLETRGGADTVTTSGALPESLLLEAHGQSGDDSLAGGPGPDELDGGPGADRLSGLGGADLLRGGADPDTFTCDSADTLLDLAPDDIAEGACAPVGTGPGQQPEPGQPEPGQPEPGSPEDPPLPSIPGLPGDAAPGGGGPVAPAGLPRGFTGFAKPKITLTRTGLRVVLRNTHSSPITVSVAATEKRGRKRFAYKRVRKTIAAGRSTTLVLKAPRALLRARGTRKPAVTVTNVATGGKVTARR